MRIIAGELKGRSINLPKGSRTRPTTGQVRELLMNLLGDTLLLDRPFLDLCAGSGITGLEALSRGASKAVFVETDARMARQLRETVNRLDVSDRVNVLQKDVRRCWRAVEQCLDGDKLGSAFLDPPFISGMAKDLLQYCGKGRGLFATDSYLVVRSPELMPDSIPGFAIAMKRGQGPGTLWFYSPIPNVNLELLDPPELS